MEYQLIVLVFKSSEQGSERRRAGRMQKGQLCLLRPFPGLVRGVFFFCLHNVPKYEFGHGADRHRRYRRKKHWLIRHFGDPNSWKTSWTKFRPTVKVYLANPSNPGFRVQLNILCSVQMDVRPGRLVMFGARCSGRGLIYVYRV